MRGDGVELECGLNACGGACGPMNGQCPWDANCEEGICEPCQPDCDGRECGGDGCGGICMGKELECDDLGVCDFDTGQCSPCPAAANCANKSCGPDGCGGTCGPGCNAAAGEVCTADQQCAAVLPADACAARPEGERCCVNPPGDDGSESNCTAPSGRCYCDDACDDERFNDCCADYQAVCAPTTGGGGP